MTEGTRVDDVITAVDSSVLWAIVNEEPTCDAWTQLLARAAAEGPLIICPVAFAELAPVSPSSETLLKWLDGFDIAYSKIEPAAAHLAGEKFDLYRAAGGPRKHLIPDFLIAAHAMTQANRLACSDRGYQRRWFPNLSLLKVTWPTEPLA